MTVYIGGQLLSDDGALEVLARPVSGVPSSAVYLGGWAHSQDGEAYVEEAEDSVPSTSVKIGGAAFTPDGAAYCTQDEPDSSSFYIGALAYRADGALHITGDDVSGAVYVGGLACTQAGALYVTGLPWTFSEVLDYYDARYGITEDVGVAAWEPVLKGTHTLEQATDANQPAWTDGNSILFDGSNDSLKSASFTLEQPTTIVMVVKMVTWTVGDCIFDGDADNGGALYQSANTPEIRQYAGANGDVNNGLAVDNYGIVSSVFNGAASALQVNLNTPVVSNPGAGDMNGFTLGKFGGPSNFNSNIQVKAIAICDSGLSAARLNELVRAMNAVYSVF